MNTARRAIVGGAFGALATATVAASAAFACHPISYLELSHAQGPPGMTMRVEGNGFDPGIDLEIRWADGATVTEVLGTTEVKAVDTVTGRAQAVATVQIPVNAAVRAEPYTIVGTQVGANGNTFRAVKRFTVVAPAAPPQVQDPVTPPVENMPATPGPEAGPPVLPATPEQVPATPVAAMPAANSSTAGPVAAARPSATTGRTDTAAPPAPATAAPPAPVTAGAPAAAARTSDAVAAAPAPSAASPAAAQTAAPGPDDLWSAVSAERQPSLLDAPASTPQSGGAPVGGILTGAGVLALAGAALLAGRRRLALARLR